MLIGMLSGCANKGNELSGAAANYVDSEEKLTLSWLGFPGWQDATEGTPSELALEEAFNVDIKPLFYEYGKYNDQKINLFASGEVPDLIYPMVPVNLFTDVDQGFIAELPYETIKTYAPELCNYITENIGPAWLFTRYHGANWGLPNWCNYHMAGGNSAVNYLTPIRDQQIKLIAQIITGEKSIDDYDEFIEYFYANGGQKMLDETKEVKGELDAVMKAVK